MAEAHLILSDGKIFSGESFGYRKKAKGELVFNTSMTGYQEVLTDPSYCGQMVIMTYPEIGNTGINALDVESKKVFLSAFIIKKLSHIPSNYRSQKDLDTYLKENKIPGIKNIDTRALVRHIREKGALPALLIQGKIKDKKEILKEAKQLQTMEGQDLVSQVSCKKPYKWSKPVEPPYKWLKKDKVESKYSIIAYDYGIKENILRMLVDHGCDVKVVPASYPASKVLEANPDGIFLSNGPGDPAAVSYAIENVKELLGKKPIFGICLGHQILSLALGLKSYKLKFGHHGGNQPVMDLESKKVEISSQNHGFAIDIQDLPKGVEVSHINLNDKTVEGIKHQDIPAFSVQYHPEASPGPHDSSYLFKKFQDMMEDA